MTGTPTFDAISPVEFDALGQFTDTVAGDVRNPYPGWAAKRRDTPVERSMMMGFDGAETDTAVVYTHDLVAEVLRNNTTFSSGTIRHLMEVVMGPYVLVGMDEPEHRRHRQLVAQAFRHKTLAHYETDLIEGTVHRQIDTFAHRGVAELVRDFTFTFPVQVIAEVLGVPHEDHVRFHDWAVAIINVAADPVAGLEASQAMRDYLSHHVEARRRDPGNDVISDLVTAELDGEVLDDEEIYSFLRLLLPAGAETTYRATGNFLYGLLTNPDQMEDLRADRDLMPQAVEEAVRWESPLLITSRTALDDTEIGGVEVPAGTHVIANLGSANHDETRWENPEDFDLHREPIPHIAFGLGPHMCLGMHLARLELKVAVNAILDRLPDLRLDPGDYDPHIRGERFRSPTCLPVRF